MRAYSLSFNPLGCVQNRIQIGGFGTVRVVQSLQERRTELCKLYFTKVNDKNHKLRHLLPPARESIHYNPI